MIKKASTKKVTLSLSLKWPINYPLPVFPSISHGYYEWQKIHICTKNRNVNVDVIDHCLVSNIQKNEITGIRKDLFGRLSFLADSLWLFVRGLWSSAGGFWSFVVVFGGLWSLPVLVTTRYMRQVYIWEADTHKWSK